MLNIGRNNTFKIAAITATGAELVHADGSTYFLPQKQLPAESEVGQSLEVFVYLADGQVVVTVDKPLVQVGECAFLKVVEVNPVGAFLDWGLPKDLLLPYGEQRRRLQPGNKQMVYVYLDKASRRITASTRIHKFLKEDNSPFKAGEAVEVMFWGRSDLGYKAIINNEYLGLLHHSDVYETISVGQRRTAYIKSINPDGKINLAVHLPNKEQLGDLAEQIYQDLVENNGVSKLTDNSDPADIKARWHVSKGSYKKALGKLFKARKIIIGDTEITLKK